MNINNDITHTRCTSSVDCRRKPAVDWGEPRRRRFVGGLRAWLRVGGRWAGAPPRTAFLQAAPRTSEKQDGTRSRVMSSNSYETNGDSGMPWTGVTSHRR